MRKTILITFLGLLLLTTSAFSVHKFYMAIYQVNYAPEKKMLQITSRIFVDDLNLALEKKYHKKFNFGTEKEATEDVAFLKKYLAEHFSIKINGQVKPMTFLSKELEGDVLVCYLRINAVTKINAVEILNSVLTEYSQEQQNITHISVLGTKNTILCTDSSKTGLLKY